MRYDRLGVLFVNAFKEQQAEIQQQRVEIKKEQAVIKQQQFALTE